MHPHRPAQRPGFGLRRARSAPLRGGGGQGAPEAAGPLVMIAEDEPRSRSALAELLREAGYRVRAAADGAELLALAAAEPPSVVLLDLAMPRCNGIEAARQLREMERAPAIIATTSSWLGERLDLLAPEGFDAALRKPFAPQRVLELLEQVVPAAGMEALTC